MSSAAVTAAAAAEHAHTAEQLRAFTDGFQAKALHIIYVVIPEKIETLQAILTKWKALPCDKAVFTPAGAQCNQSIMQLMVPIKHEIHTLLALVDPLRMWVSLNIPKIQDQKGMAVSVKEDLVEMLHSSKVSAMGLMESLCKYHVGRGKLVSKKIKFPLSADHDVGIQQLDEKQYFMMLNMINDLKNNYSLVYDMMIKNMDKVVKAQDTDNYRNMY